MLPTELDHDSLQAHFERVWQTPALKSVRFDFIERLRTPFADLNTVSYGGCNTLKIILNKLVSLCDKDWTMLSVSEQETVCSIANRYPGAVCPPSALEQYCHITLCEEVCPAPDGIRAKRLSLPPKAFYLPRYINFI